MLGTTEQALLEHHGISISPDEKKFLINFGRGKRQSFSETARLIPLKSQFANEFIAESIQKKHYLEADERDFYRVCCEGTFFYSADRQPLCGAYVYVLLPNDCLFCVEVSKNINHSYLSTGLGVKGAGIAYFEAGRLMTLSNESGHYAPTLDEMTEAIDWFYQQVKGHRFLFEDHSVQDKDVEFNGIRYFVVGPQGDDSTCKKELLPNNDLSQVLHEIRTAELRFYYEHGAIKNLIDFETFPPLIEQEDTEDVYTTTLSLETLQLPSNSTIFDFPELLNLTVLSKFNDSLKRSKPLSRYGCVLKHSLGK